MNCLHCNIETQNPKYCSKSCSAKSNNVLYPKRKITRTCLVCDSPVTNYRKARCDFHTEEYKQNKHRQMTIGEYRNKVSVAGKHPSWVHAHVRAFARSWLKHLAEQPCKHCGYKKHVELAHIKSLSSYPDPTPLSEINCESNVIPLCPNCHWEFDNLPRNEI